LYEQTLVKMTKKSERERNLHDIYTMIKFCILSRARGSKKRRKRLRKLIKLAIVAQSCRYHGSRTNKVPRVSCERISGLFGKYDDRRFRQIFRVDKDTFVKIHNEIKGNSVFKNNSRHRQRPSWLQLAVFMSRVGRYGNGASAEDMSSKFGIGQGTVRQYMQRVAAALIDVKDKWVYWPVGEEMNTIRAQMAEKGFINCVGGLDGTLCPLQVAPSIDGECYFDRYKRYSVGIQIVAAPNYKITYADIGRPGGGGDKDAQKFGEMWNNPKNFFERKDYLLVDAGYTISRHFVGPYIGRRGDSRENALFNHLLAKARVFNEQTIGILVISIIVIYI